MDNSVQSVGNRNDCGVSELLANHLLNQKISLLVDIRSRLNYSNLLRPSATQAISLSRLSKCKLIVVIPNSNSIHLQKFLWIVFTPFPPVSSILHLRLHFCHFRFLHFRVLIKVSEIQSLLFSQVVWFGLKCQFSPKPQ